MIYTEVRVCPNLLVTPPRRDDRGIRLVFANLYAVHLDWTDLDRLIEVLEEARA